ncbi:MAG: dicarboxylate/amino acid:cation symporter [Gemmatimonadetes bacterium]|nr:dicarboxylate/amino acid:cation symporter [Gemmatimonadota bacterium]
MKAPTSNTSSAEGIRAVSALLIGFTIGAVLNAVRPSLANALLGITDPVGTLWVNSIRMTVVPLVTTLLITGVTQSRAGGEVGRLGGRVLLVMSAMLVAIASLTALLAPPIYRSFSVDPAAAQRLRESVAGGVASAPEIPSFVSWVTSLVPVNPVKAAVDGAMLPLIVFTIAFAMAIRLLGDHERETVSGFFRGVSDAMMVMVRWVLALAPLGIGALAISLGVRLGVGAAGAVGFYFASLLGLLVVAILVMYVIAFLFTGVPIGLFARAILPAQAIAAGTRSTLAAIPVMIEAATQKLGVSPAGAGFVIPFCVSTFRLNLTVSWIVGGLFLAKLYGIDFPISSVITLGVAAAALSFSVPGIPSGSLFIITPILVQVGLPAEGVGVLIALDALPDVLKTSLNATAQMTAMTIATRPERVSGVSVPTG